MHACAFQLPRSKTRPFPHFHAVRTSSSAATHPWGVHTSLSCHVRATCNVHTIAHMLKYLTQPFLCRLAEQLICCFRVSPSSKQAILVKVSFEGAAASDDHDSGSHTVRQHSLADLSRLPVPVLPSVAARTRAVARALSTVRVHFLCKTAHTTLLCGIFVIAQSVVVMRPKVGTLNREALSFLETTADAGTPDTKKTRPVSKLALDTSFLDGSGASAQSIPDAKPARPVSKLVLDTSFLAGGGSAPSTAEKEARAVGKLKDPHGFLASPPPPTDDSAHDDAAKRKVEVGKLAMDRHTTFLTSASSTPPAGTERPKSQVGKLDMSVFSSPAESTAVDATPSPKSATPGKLAIGGLFSSTNSGDGGGIGGSVQCHSPSARTI